MNELRLSRREFDAYNRRIVGLEAAGREFQFGSGFFFQFPVSENDDHQVPVPITNNHVINCASKIGFVVHTASDGGKTKRQHTGGI